MVNNAGNNIGRTINVSINTPNATVKPNNCNSRTGWVINTANVAANNNPADEMTPPVAINPLLMASIGSRTCDTCRIRDYIME